MINEEVRSVADENPAQSTLLDRAANVATHRPWLIIGGWLVVMAVLAVLGMGVGGKLSTRPVYADGSATERAREIAVREFGDEEAFIIMLRGPRAGVDRQGHQLLRRLGSVPGTVVISPWSSAETIPGLRPAPGVATLLVEVTPRSGEGTLELVASVRQRVHATIRVPVRASVAGGPVIIDSFHRAAEDAASAGERIAIPILLIVLLIVFRSLLAAVIPVIVGGAVVAATRGVMDLSLGFIQIESFALGPAGMMGLALGVDYTLLVVSRFREQIEDSGDVTQAIRTTVRSTGRAVIPAGCGLIFAMLVGSFVLSSPLLVSAAFVVIIVAILSMLSAILVTPSVLMLLGRNLDRWALPIRPSGQSTFARWSESLSGQPLVLAPTMAIVLALAVWAFAMKSEAATVPLLPHDDTGRLQQEDIEAQMGPGWAAPLEIVMDGRDRPVTAPQRLRALARFQDWVEADPDVVAMAGLAPIARNTRALGGAKDELASQDNELARLQRGIAGAAAGTDRLDTAVGVAADGSEQLASGLGAASDGSRRLASGLDRTGAGSARLAGGLNDARAGSARLASGLARARKQGSQAAASSYLLENALRSGNEGLDVLHSPLRESERQLAVALEALREMSGEGADPGYTKALRSIEVANESLTGKSASTGERMDPSYEGIGAGIEQAQNQFSLSMYLAHRIDKDGKKATRGLKRLQVSSSQLVQGLDQLSAGSRQISAGIARLQRGGHAISPGLQRLTAGAEHLTAGLNEIDAGAEGLAGGLGSGTQGLKRLTGALGGIEAGVKRQAPSQTGGSQLGRLQDRSPRLFQSGYFYLASLDGSRPSQRRQAAFLINLDRGGHAARMVIIPRHGSVSSKTEALRKRLDEGADNLARETGSEVVVSGVPAIQADLNKFYRDQAPLLRLALLLVSVVVLVAVLRSLIMPIVAALLNLATVAASFGVLALLFNDSFIGGPGYVDSTVVPATIMVMFGLAIDYEVFIFARMREEYVRTGSPEAAVKNGIDHTAHVVTGAAIIMIGVFVAFSLSPFVTIRDFGVAQAIGVFIDAFIIRLLILPALMRALGKWSWWLPWPFSR